MQHDASRWVLGPAGRPHPLSRILHRHRGLPVQDRLWDQGMDAQTTTAASPGEDTADKQVCVFVCACGKKGYFLVDLPPQG